MAYVKNTWVDREGTTRYHETVDEDGALIFTPDYEKVTEIGTPVNADNMNHIEEGIYSGSFTKYDANGVYEANDLVTVIEDGSPVIYKSLQDNNTGNALSDTTYWEKISLGGGGSGFNLFDTKSSDHVLTGEEAKGWALQGSYVNGAVYPTFYAKCLEEYNEATTTETVNGVTVKVHSNGHKFYNISDKTAIDEFFNTIGSAWFYGVDTENERVFLPRNNYFDQLTGDVSQVGDSVEAGLPNITGTFVATNWSGKNATGAITKTTDGTEPISGGGGLNDTRSSYSLDASRSNAIYGNSDTVQPNAVKKLLYICVGNTIVNEDQIDVSKVLSEAVLRSSLEEIQTVIETYVNGDSWYRIWSDGWCEQGAVATNTTTSGIVVNLLKNYTDSNYTVIATDKGNTSSYIEVAVGSFTTSSFMLFNNGHNVCWQASGYIW